LRLSLKVSDLASLAKRIAIEEGITESELRSGSMTKLVSKARRLFCHVAVEQLGYPGAHVARFLGATTSAVVRAAHSENLNGMASICKLIQKQCPAVLHDVPLPISIFPDFDGFCTGNQDGNEFVRLFHKLCLHYARINKQFQPVNRLFKLR
jgi:hypothetical protein